MNFKNLIMKIEIGTNQILKILYIISWIIFIGLCIEAGGIIFNAVLAQVVPPEKSQLLWKEIDLTHLRQFDKGYFLTQTVLISIVVVLKAIMFYLIVKILHDKKLNLVQPFNKEVGKFIANLSYLALGISLFSYWGAKNALWLSKQGVQMPSVTDLRIGGADVWLFMCIVLYVIAQIFKKGIELQEENELTI